MRPYYLTALCAFVLSQLFGCASVSQKLDPSVYYKRDIKICIDKKCSEGTAVLPRQLAYPFEITSKGKMDLFTFTTCHREMTQEKLGTTTVAPYVPVASVEDTSYCPVELGGYEKEKGRHSWGFIDFESPDDILPARVSCNGREYDSKGVSVCQSRNGLLQRMVFNEAVRVSSGDSGRCALPTSPDGRVYTIALPLGECVYVFMGTESGQTHRLTTIGYEGILIRDL